MVTRELNLEQGCNKIPDRGAYRRLLAWEGPISLKEKLVCLALSELIGSGPSVDVTQQIQAQLADMTGLPKPKIWALVCSLRNNDLVSIRKRGTGRHTVSFQPQDIPFAEYVPHRHSAPGFVYLVKCGQHYKIGRTTSLPERIKALSTANVASVELIAARHVHDSISYERFLHTRYEDCRIRGEWFHLTRVQTSALRAALSEEAA